MGNNLCYYRIKHHMTTTELGNLAGCVQHHAITFHEKKKLSAKAAIKYAEALNENPVDLLGTDILTFMPRSEIEKEKIIEIVRGIKINDDSDVDNSDSTDCSESGNISTLGKTIRELRFRNMMSATELAGKLGITYVQLNNIESGRCLPKINKICDYAEALNVDVDTLVDLWISDKSRRTGKRRK